MSTEEINYLKIGDLLTGSGDGYDEILKVISDGVLVLHYSLAHNSYCVEFLSTFSDLSNYRKCDIDELSFVPELFEGNNIKHNDWFGSCEPVNK